MDYWYTCSSGCLDNPKRAKSILYLTKEAQKKIDIGKNQLPIKYLSRQEINNLLNNLSNHQGAALKVSPLKHPSLEEYLSLENKKKPYSDYFRSTHWFP